jgi:hypothetical protein
LLLIEACIKWEKNTGTAFWEHLRQEWTQGKVPLKGHIITIYGIGKVFGILTCFLFLLSTHLYLFSWWETESSWRLLRQCWVADGQRQGCVSESWGRGGIGWKWERKWCVPWAPCHDSSPGRWQDSAGMGIGTLGSRSPAPTGSDISRKQ